MSKIVKSDEASGYESALVFDFADVETHAQQIIAQAQAEAAGIVEAGSLEAEEHRLRVESEAREAGRAGGFEEGREAGLEEGRREAFEAARAQLDELSRSLTKGFEEFSAKKDELFKQAEVDLLDLSLLIARKVIAREIAADDHVTVDNLRRCLDVLSTRKNVTVRVAPAVMKTVEEAMGDLVKGVGAVSSVTLEADDAVSPGGCVITGQAGSLDATIETQLAEVETILFGKCDG